MVRLYIDGPLLVLFDP